MNEWMNELIKTPTGKFPQYPHPPTTPAAKKKSLIIFNW